MRGRELEDLDTLPGESRIVEDEDRLCANSRYGLKGRHEVVGTSHENAVQLQADPAASRLQCRDLRLVGWVCRIRQHTDPDDLRKGLSEQRQSFEGQLGVVEAQARDVSAWMSQARHEH